MSGETPNRNTAQAASRARSAGPAAYPGGQYIGVPLGAARHCHGALGKQGDRHLRRTLSRWRICRLAARTRPSRKIPLPTQLLARKAGEGCREQRLTVQRVAGALHFERQVKGAIVFVPTAAAAAWCAHPFGAHHRCERLLGKEEGAHQIMSSVCGKVRRVGRSRIKWSRPHCRCARPAQLPHGHRQFYRGGTARQPRAVTGAH